MNMIQNPLPGIFDAQAYWSDRPHKKWVVEFTDNSGRTDTCIACSATEDGAIRQARSSTTMRGRMKVSARLAHPEDLECVEASPAVSHRLRLLSGRV
jgi:hypothetical protein